MKYKNLLEEADMTEIKGNTFEQCIVILFLRAPDRRIYGTMQDEYFMDFANKKYNYQYIIIDMVDVMQ